VFQRVAEHAYVAWILALFQYIADSVTSINPSQSAVLWIQIIAGLLTVIWIIFQFAWMRRLNEARLERYLEERIATEREDLAQERANILAQLDRAANRRGLSYRLLLAWANFRLAISFVLRMLSLGTVRGLASDTMMLVHVGMFRQARRVHSAIAFDAMKKIKLYEDAIANKRVEAQNALIFAGRIAVLEGRPVAAVSSFKKATSLQEDPDARVLIGKQLAIATDFEGALREYQAALKTVSVNSSPATKAEAHRGIAEIRIKEGRPGLARQSLREAQRLDEPQRDYLGLGRTHMLFGDLYVSRASNHNTAIQAYSSAIEDFRRANDQHGEREAARKLRNLTDQGPPGIDDWATRALDRCAQAIRKIVERRRAQG
jgi:tetratricopeptide (TPR) repeat protein